MEETLMQCELKMESALEHLSSELSKVRTGRANPQMLNSVFVDYYGTSTPINQISNISVPEPTQLLVKPYDRSLIKEFEKSIQSSGLGINPQNEGDQLRINIPPLTEDRRKDMVKQTKKIGEDAKVNIRNIRRDFNDIIKKAEKNSEISEDDSQFYQDEIQRLTDQFIVKVDEKAAAKEKDLMTV
jgi:ribosome recycling factor